jgi:murein DD-endopeptidase MepM/ murein hydrolase activator NlpD
LKYLLILIIIFAGLLIFNNKSKIPILSPIISVSPTPSPVSNKLSEPIFEFKQRVTKKFFGIYITPQNSPIKSEKFTGFHTAVDVEYEDTTDDIPVYSINNGQIIYSGKVNGYGGFIAIQYSEYIGIYGHLRPNSLLPNNSIVKKGDTIGVLGTGYTSETDDERKHLHFAILKGSKLDFRGYVESKSELSLWLNPLDLFP